MQTETIQPEDKLIMPETRFNAFPAFSVYPRLGFLGLHRRRMFDYFSYVRHQKYYLSFVICFILNTLCRITTFFERHSVFFVEDIRDVTSEI